MTSLFNAALDHFQYACAIRKSSSLVIVVRKRILRWLTISANHRHVSAVTPRLCNTHSQCIELDEPCCVSMIVSAFVVLESRDIGIEQ
ncbi:hypothetical protein SAMN05421881_100417 [Nitrosomonas halophila]|uniref:Uncharacterized protein n=1 Tax=Nitrosomonas halophila TaxID=44576 RepID=A0A1H3D139_9PROT|nr:hypothetical protein SAMN05421881_100417 [Nitrosomonas halophila]